MIVWINIDEWAQWSQLSTSRLLEHTAWNMDTRTTLTCTLHQGAGDPPQHFIRHYSMPLISSQLSLHHNFFYQNYSKISCFKLLLSCNIFSTIIIRFLIQDFFFIIFENSTLKGNKDKHTETFKVFLMGVEFMLYFFFLWTHSTMLISSGISVIVN